MHVYHLFLLIVPLIFFLAQIVYCCWIAFELVYCYVFVVETKGLSLEETAALFDGTSDRLQLAGQQAAQLPYSVSDDKSDNLEEKVA
jgi:hypothetical protein